MNKLMTGLGHRLEFGVFEDTDQLFVKVVDRRSNKVVKVLPPEDFLQLRQKIADAVGLLLDDQL
jgi:flagellar protein FlaG